MKTKIYLCIAYCLIVSSFLQTANAQANRALSNLVSPTKVNQSVVPITTNSKDLGTFSMSWRSTYLAGSIYLDGKRFLTNGNDSTNIFTGTDAGNKRGVSHIGGYNTATGHEALYSYTTGGFNTANGAYALFFNTVGVDNTASGYQALYLNTTGSYNTGNGFRALYSNISGVQNTANGYRTLYSNITGHYNTAIGFSAGSVSDNSIFCTFIGYAAYQSTSTDFTNSTALGNACRITASNQVRIGNSSVASIGGYEPWTTISDGRFKKNIKEDVPGLAFINQLHAITYTVNVSSLRNFLGEDRQHEADAEMVREKNSEATALIQKGIEEKEKIIRTGFVAQDVEEAAKKIGYDFSGVDKPGNENTPYGLRYSEFVVPLVKAVQELSAKNDELQKQNDTQKKINDNLQKQIDELKAMIQANRFSAEIFSASLEQNIPNPFNNTTIIRYTLPEKSSSAKIIITDKHGKTLKELNVQGNGKGSIYVDAATFSSGTYQYSLIVDGKLTDTKQMEHLK